MIRLEIIVIYRSIQFDYRKRTEVGNVSFVLRKQQETQKRFLYAIQQKSLNQINGICYKIAHPVKLKFLGYLSQLGYTKPLSLYIL